MNFTTKDINAYQSDVRKDILNNVPYILEIKEQNERNRDIETRAIGTKSSICSPSLSKKLEGNVDYGIAKSIMGDEFMNYNAIRAIGCSVYSTFHGIPQSSGNIAKVAHLKNIIQNLHQFGSESVNGYALTGNLGDEGTDMFVLKTPRKPNAVVDLMHELFVVLFGINRLRKVFPNMAMIFGGLKSSEPIINTKTKQVESYFAPSVNQVPYVIYENISPSKSFAEIIHNCSINEFYSIYLQILYATYIASELIGYTHYDSHNENWLIRYINVPGVTDVSTANGNFCIPYKDPISKTVSYVVANSVATAIDFGMASINYNGVDIGCSDIGLEEYGVTSGPWPLHDAYKVFMFSAHSLLTERSNTTLFDEFKKIFRFFNTSESLENAVINQRKSFYSLPKAGSVSNWGIIDLINHIKINCDLSDVLLDIPTYPVLECTSCYTFAGAIEGSYITEPYPKDFFEFYDFAYHYGSSSKKSYDKMVSKFDYNTALTDFKNKVKNHISKIPEFLEYRQRYPSNQLITARTLANPNYVQKLQSEYSNLVSAISYYEDVELWLKVGMSVAILYQDTKTIAYINGERNNLKEYESPIKQWIGQLRELYRKIVPIITSPEWNIYAQKYAWYTTSSGEIIYLRDRFDKDIRELFVEHRLPSTLTNPNDNLKHNEYTVLPTKRNVNLIRNKYGVPSKVEVSRS